jgi:hypothetical protein
MKSGSRGDTTSRPKDMGTFTRSLPEIAVALSEMLRSRSSS